MAFQLNSPLIQRGPCVSIDEMGRALQTLLEALDNPGPIKDPDGPSSSPCGEIIGSAYVADIASVPTVVYVDDDGVCQSITPGSGTDIDIVLATVDSPGVSAGPGTFAASWVANIQGSESNTGAGQLTFDNVHERAYATGDQILGIKRSSDGNYVTVQDETGTYAGTTVDTGTIENTTYICRFSLDEDMTRNATSAQATRESDSADIIVLDPFKTYVGRASWEDPEDTRPAFRGYGIKVAEDYLSSGKPGYAILSMEGWARALVVQVISAHDTADTSFPCNVVGQVGSANCNHIGPPIEDPTYDLTVYDQYGMVTSCRANDRFLVMMRDESGSASPKYDFVARMEPRFIRIKGLTTSAITRANSTVTLDNVTAVSGESPVELSTDTVTADIPSYAKIDCPDNTELYALYDHLAGSSDTDRWNVGDAANLHWMLRGKAEFDETKQQALINVGAAEADMKWGELVDANFISSLGPITIYQEDDALKVDLEYKYLPSLVVKTGDESDTQTLSGDTPTTTC